MSSRRRKGHAEEHHVDERWLVSYADMITVLMALFIVLYAMSTVDSHKYDQLKNSLASGFGVTKTAKIDQQDAIVPKEYVKKNGAGFSATTLSAKQEAKEVQKYLAKAGATAQVKASGTTVTISLVGSAAYFDGNQADLRPEAVKVLHAIAPTLKKHVGKITVEGHASPEGTAGAFGDDWYLSATRARNVLTALVDEHAVKGSNISGTFFGSEGASGGSSAAVQDKNRRVDIVLHQPPAADTTETSTGTEVAAKADPKADTKTEAASTH